MQSLFADIPAFNQKQNSLSGHDQVTEILVKKIKLPVEVVDKVFCFVPTTYLIDVLGARFDQIPTKKVTFESFKNELVDGCDNYSINHSGSMVKFDNNESPYCWFLCKPIFMKFMFVNFKSEIIDFLLEEDGELYDNWGNSVISVVHIAMHNRLDLCEIVFSETDKFNKITDSIDLAADNGNFQVVKYLTSKGVSCTTKAMDWAASKGHFKLFKWLHLNRSEGCTGGSLGFASINGFLEIVKYIIENRLVSGRMQLNQSLEKAKFKGRLNVVEYLESVLEMTV